MRACVRSLPALLGGVVLSGCPTYPCERDVLACEDGDAFVIDRSCEVDDELVLALGDGEGRFTALEDAAWPVLHHGVQGGIHFTVGLRLEHVDPDHGEFEIEVEARDCDARCPSMEVLATRTFVIDEGHFEHTDAALELADVVLLLDRQPRAAGEIAVTVTDSCGRVAASLHAAGPQ